MSLTDLASVKAHLGIPGTDTDQDARLSELILVADAMIENHTGRQFEQATVVEDYDGDRSDTILLRRWPVTAITEVREDTESEFTSATTIVPSDEYTFDTEQGFLLRKYTLWEYGIRSVRVSYTGGYSTVPYDLKHAANLIVEYFYRQRSDKRLGVTSKGKQGESVSFETAIPTSILTLLDKYIRYEFTSSVSVRRS